MSAHRTLNDMYRAFDAVGPGILDDPGNGGTIRFSGWGQICPITTTTGETATLAQPNRPGLIGTVGLDVDGGDLTLTVTGGYNADGDTSIVFGDAGDFVTFISIKVGTSYYWRVLRSAGTDVKSEPTTIGDAVTAEHGAGAIGTAFAPRTYRYTRDGDIITEIHIDMTGLASVAAANDIIGLAAGTPPAYIGRNVVATNGIIYRVEMKCLETPATADDDINLVTGSNGTEHIDDPVTGANVVINSGDWVIGMQVASDVPKITADHYFFLTAGTGGAETYTAGQFVIRLYGHAALA